MPATILRNIDYLIFCGQQSTKITKSSYEYNKLKNSRANKQKTRFQPLALQQLEEAYNKVKKKNHYNCNKD